MRVPRRSVRLRLARLYGILFFISGGLLLAAVGSATVSRSSSVARVGVRPPGAVPPLPSKPVDTSTLSHQLILASLIGLGVMTVVSLGLGWLVAGRALRPVQEMTEAAQRISEHNLNERLAVTGPKDELKELGDTFDGLLQRLETAFNAQRRFVANASHELRTPLTTMRASLDVALAKPEPAPPATVALAGRLRTELDRIDGLLEAFLVLARAQHRDLPGVAVLPLDYLVTAALGDQAARIGAKGLTVRHSESPDGAWVAGNQALLSRLVQNVIDNAVGHNEDGGWIAISSDSDSRAARLVVENGGQVLSQSQADELTQPFRRFGADRTGSDKGSGLGLSIVAAITDAHGGTVDLHARDGGGLRVTVELPVALMTSVVGVGRGGGLE
ncbi:MAG TPA: ATP-binding protein [Streptosporangiaceae bacterium]|nr:ATP-binding protein [Streptosporangiaceae bacterium]